MTPQKCLFESYTFFSVKIPAEGHRGTQKDLEGSGGLNKANFLQKTISRVIWGEVAPILFA